MEFEPDEVRAKEDKGLRRYALERCQLCDSPKDLLICERAHGKMFCRDCSSKTIKVNEQRHVFKAKCLNPECTFIPLIPWNR